jgi:hypothetical protein
MKIKTGFNEGYIEGVYDERKRIKDIIENGLKQIPDIEQRSISYVLLMRIKQKLENTEVKE